MFNHMPDRRYHPFLRKGARLLLIGALAIGVSFLWVVSVLASARIFPTGVTIYDPTRAYNCYVIFDAPDAKTHLIDMDGNEVHRWAYSGAPSLLLDPKLTGGQRGHVLVKLQGIGGPENIIGFITKTVGELDWQGNVVWQWGDKAPGGSANQNHDLERLPNGNTLLVVTLNHPIPGFSAPQTADHAIYEVSPAGDIVWRWVSSDHLEEFGFSPEGLRLIRSGFVTSTAAKGAGFLTINSMKSLGPNRWFEAGDARFRPDNILINSREGDFVALIEKATGKVVWRVGPDYPATDEEPQVRLFNKQIPRPVDQMSGEHDANLIPEGLPGAGDILVFDNEGPGGFPPVNLPVFGGSRVLEINPIKKEIVWQYTGEDSDRNIWTFGSTFISSARRLPNGNTLIDEGMNGRIFQVTPKGDIVWEYINPYFGRGSMGGPIVLSNWVYRGLPVPYDWVPPGTPRSEDPVAPPDVSRFRVPPNP